MDSEVKPTIKLDRAAPSANRHMQWGSDVIAETLRRIGIKYITHNPGSSFRGLHDSLVNYLGNESPTFLLCLNENQAVAIAHGYAKVTGEPMGCILHANVGLLNGAMGIFNAWVDRVPMFVMSAGGPADANRRVPWINWIHTARDQAGYVRAFTKWDDEPRSPEAAIEAMLRANMLTRTAPCAPVHLYLDAALQEDELARPVHLPDAAKFQPPPSPEPDAGLVEAAADLLAASRRPVILAGRVSRQRRDWDARVALAELLGARVLTDLKLAAAFPSEHPLHAGIAYHFRGGHKDMLAEADVVLALDWLDLGNALKASFGADITAKVIDCSLDSYLHNADNMNYFSLAPADIRFQAEPDRVVVRLIEALRRRLAAPGYNGGTLVRPPASHRADGGATQITLSDLGNAVAELASTGGVTLTRIPLGFDPATCRFADPLDYLGNDGGVGIGSGPGNSVGAALALQGSGRVAVGVIGDSDFVQGATALWTAAHYNIPVLLIVANNRSHLNDELIQERVAIQRGRAVENRWIGQRIDDPPVAIATIAKGFGVAADGPVRELADLKPALAKGLARARAGEPFVVEVLVAQGSAARLAEYKPDRA